MSEGFASDMNENGYNFLTRLTFLGITFSRFTGLKRDISVDSLGI